MKKVIKLIILLTLSLLMLSFLMGCSNNDNSKNNSDVEKFANEMKKKDYKFELKDIFGNQFAGYGS